MTDTTQPSSTPITAEGAVSEATIQRLADLHFYQEDAATMDIRLHRFARAVIGHIATESAAIQPAGEAEQFCPACGGSGEVSGVEGSGPDQYEISVTCPHCKGNALLLDAYTGVVELLRAEQSAHQSVQYELYVATSQLDAKAEQDLSALSDDAISAAMAEGNRHGVKSSVAARIVAAAFGRAPAASNVEAVSERVDLHAAIMNLPTGKSFPEYQESITQRMAYKSGHRDARHAAAELVASNNAEALLDDLSALQKKYDEQNTAFWATSLKLQEAEATLARKSAPIEAGELPSSIYEIQRNAAEVAIANELEILKLVSPMPTQRELALLAGIQALCISADQEWCRQNGSISEFDKGWFTGQLHIFDMYTEAGKDKITEARQYIERLSATAQSENVACTNCNGRGKFDTPLGSAECKKCHGAGSLAAPFSTDATGAEEALRKELSGWIDEAAARQRMIDGLTAASKLRYQHDSKDFWYWQGDGSDHLESMSNGMAVLIRADHLRDLLATKPASTASIGDDAVLRNALNCLEILNQRPRPMCRDCADEDGICPSSGLQCDMRKLIGDAYAALDARQSVAAPDAREADDFMAKRTEEIRLRHGAPQYSSRKQIIYDVECLLAHIAVLSAPVGALTVQGKASDAEDGDNAEGLEILDDLIRNIEDKGNYTKEATLTFLGQIRQCFAARAQQQGGAA